MNDDEIQPRRFNTGDHVVTPDGRVARIQYLTGYVRDESGESNPTQAILLLPKQVRADNGDRRPHRAKPKRPHVQRTVTAYDHVCYKLSELSKATVADRERGLNVLLALWAFAAPPTAKDIARELVMNQATVVKHLRALEANGYVTHQGEHWFVTDKGAAQC